MKIEDFKVGKKYKRLKDLKGYYKVLSNGTFKFCENESQLYISTTWYPTLMDIKLNDWEELGEDERIVKIRNYITNAYKLYTPICKYYEKGFLDALSGITDIIKGSDNKIAEESL